MRLAAEMETLSQKRNFSANSKSGKLVKNARITKLGQIFDRLDSDQDGLISSEKIDRSVLSADLQVAFRPLLKELEQLEQPLDKEEFVDAAMRLYETLSQTEKNLILKFEKITNFIPSKEL